MALGVVATRVEVYDVTCPAGTPTTAPIELDLFEPGNFDVVGVTIIIPDGHAGTTGIALALGHQPILPRNPGAFISGNDEEIPFTLKGYPRGAPWTVFVVNTDTIAHAWELRFEFDDTPAPTVNVAPLDASVSASDIVAAGSPVGVT